MRKSLSAGPPDLGVIPPAMAANLIEPLDSGRPFLASTTRLVKPLAGMGLTLPLVGTSPRSGLALVLLCGQHVPLYRLYPPPSPTRTVHALPPVRTLRLCVRRPLCRWHRGMAVQISPSLRHPRQIVWSIGSRCARLGITCAWADVLMAKGDQQPNIPPAELRRQEAEFFEALARLLAARPRGTTVPEVLASDAGQRIRTKWMLKYGRQPPL